MKNIVVLNYYQDFNRNDAIFKESSYQIGESLGYPSICLKEELNKKCIEIHTPDLSKDPEALIMFDFIPIDYKMLKKQNPKLKLYLILMENEIIKPDNYKVENHKWFKKVFTWKDSLADGKKYIKYYLGNKFPENIKYRDKTKFACMIACNKMSEDERELYSERLNAINYFEKHFPDLFHLYGYGWDKEKHASYKHPVKSKTETYADYKFCFCYENARLDGYVTEKIFDVMFSGSVPIYSGNDELPRGICIDIRDFKSYDDLYKFLNNMTDIEYANYKKNIVDFLVSKESEKYTGEFFAKTIAKYMK
jgi:hypothetical protein